MIESQWSSYLIIFRLNNNSQKVYGKLKCPQITQKGQSQKNKEDKIDKISQLRNSKKDKLKNVQKSIINIFINCTYYSNPQKDQTSMQILLTILIAISLKNGLAFMQSQCLQRLGIKVLNNLSQIESGHHSLKWFQKQQTVTTATITFKRSDHKEGVVNVITSLFFLSGIQIPKGIYFQIYPQIKDSSSFNVFFKYNMNTRWNIMHFHYVVSSTYDLRFGIHQFTVQQLKQINKNIDKKQSAIKTKVNNFQFKLEVESNNVFTNVTSGAFLSGFKSESRDFTLTVKSNNSKIDSILRIQITSSVSREPIGLLKISYFVLYLFQNSKNSFYQIQSIINGNNQLGSALIGINGYKGKNIDEMRIPSRMRLLQQKQAFPVEYDPKNIADDQNLFKIYKKVFDVLQLQIINVRGVTPIAKSSRSELNSNFQQGIKELIQRGRCISHSECRQKGGNILPDRKQCLFCKKNQEYNKQCQQCQCPQRYFKNQSACDLIPPCGDKQIFDKNVCTRVITLEQSCQHINGVFNKKTKECQCINGQFKRTPLANRECIPKCQQRCQVYNVTTKKCSAFCFIQDGKKIKCKKPYEINQQKNKCVCMDKSIRGKMGNCIICPYGTLPNLEKETCQEVDLQIFKKARVRNPEIIQGIKFSH